MYKIIDYFLNIILKNINFLLNTKTDDNINLKKKLNTCIIKIIQKEELNKNIIFKILYKDLYNEKLLLHKQKDYIQLYTKLQIYIKKLYIKEIKSELNEDIYNEIICYNNIIYYFIHNYNNFILINTIIKICFSKMISLILYNIILKFINNILDISEYIDLNMNTNILQNMSNLIILRYKLINLFQYNIIPNVIKLYYKKDKNIKYIYNKLIYKNNWNVLDNRDILNYDYLNFLGGAEIITEEKQKITNIIEKVKDLQSSNEIYKHNKSFDEFIIFLSNPYIQKSILINNVQLPEEFKNILNILESNKNDTSENISLNIFNELMDTDIGKKLCKIYKQENIATDSVKNVILDLNNTSSTEKYDTNFEFTKNDIVFLTILNCLDAIKKETTNTATSGVKDNSKSNSLIINLNYPISKFKMNDKLFILK